jgi:succinyl-diaminopimelate desuccinylase
MLGHKGAAWFTAVVRGKSAHGSMPHLGDNAIVKAARAVLRLEGFDFGLAPHPQMGPPTLNVGVIHGGSKPNLVPDRTEFTLDLRTLPGQDHAGLREIIARRLGPEVEIEPGVAAEAVWTPPEDPWAVQVFDIMEGVLGRRPEPQGLSYFTDAPNLAGAMGGPPIIILGPGEPEQAHQTDEFCRVDRIAQAAEAYLEIGARWLGL